MSNSMDFEEARNLGEWLKINELRKTSMPLDEFINRTLELMRSICQAKSAVVAYDLNGGKVNKDSVFLTFGMRNISETERGGELIEIINQVMCLSLEDQWTSFESFHEDPKFAKLARGYGCAAGAPIRKRSVPGVPNQTFGAVVALWDRTDPTLIAARQITELLPDYARFCYEKLAFTLREMFVWTDSKRMMRVKEQVEQFAPTSFSILILGERGTGKTALATEIHRCSGRPIDRFWTIPCSTYSSDVFEVVLFGCRKGAFTGAEEDRQGVVEIYDRGTIFLDEIGNLAPTTQEKLLHFLQTKTFTRYGDNLLRRSDIRLVFATNESLPSLIKRLPDGKQKVRCDFLDRIVGLTIVLPPLRDRKEHVELLARHFLARFSYLHGTNIQLARDGLEQIKKELFETRKDGRKPYEGGNIHTLEKCLETAFAKCLCEQSNKISSGEIVYAIGQIDQAWKFRPIDEK